MAKVSVLIPSRNEIFLCKTVEDLLAKAAGDIEIVAVCDGYYEHNLPNDKRVKILHFGEPRGMRNALNAAAQVATGTHLLKSDGHCMFDEGYDVKLLADYHEDNWILTMRRYPLDPDNWKMQERTDHKYPIDAHVLVEPFNRYGDSTAGLHATEWRERRDQRKHIDLDLEMGSQGSSYFVSRKCWEWLGGLNQSLYGTFWLEDLELSMMAFMRGGAQMITKRTHYYHWYKGKRGRGYSTRNMGHEDALAYSTWFWMTDQPLKGRTRTMKQFIEMFPGAPTWPTDLDEIFARAKRECRNPYAVAA